MNRPSLRVAFLASTLGLVAAACGTDPGSLFGPQGPQGTGDPSGGPNNQDGQFTLDASVDYSNDPPPQWCGPAGSAPTTPAPSGSLQCPTDKNLPGCPCPEAGATAACWTGYRRNRDLGICKDGQTTCTHTGEQTNLWGPCVGEVLPDPTAKGGAAACGCFSEGQWKIENLILHFETYNPGNVTYAISTYQDPATGKSLDPKSLPDTAPPPKPADDWSKDTLKVDCAGHFQLCYELKAGDVKAPKPTDCSITKVCTGDFDYPTAGVEQALANLPGWIAPGTSSACAQQFRDVGGYGEMSVVGKTVACDTIDDGSGHAFVFHRIEYCKAICSQAGHENDPGCTACRQDGSGIFH